MKKRDLPLLLVSWKLLGKELYMEDIWRRFGQTTGGDTCGKQEGAGLEFLSMSVRAVAAELRSCMEEEKPKKPTSGPGSEGFIAQLLSARSVVGRCSSVAQMPHQQWDHLRPVSAACFYLAGAHPRAWVKRQALSARLIKSRGCKQKYAVRRGSLLTRPRFAGSWI